MKRTLTPAQTAARDERRSKLRAIAARIKAMTQEERAAQCAGMMVRNIEGHVLSQGNQLLIAFQRSGVSIVGGFRQWIKQGRCVEKGQHGLGIWVPIGNRAAAKSDSRDEAEENGVRFVFGTVFDLSQTRELKPGESMGKAEATGAPEVVEPDSVPGSPLLRKVPGFNKQVEPLPGVCPVRALSNWPLPCPMLGTGCSSPECAGQTSKALVPVRKPVVARRVAHDEPEQGKVYDLSKLSATGKWADCVVEPNSNKPGGDEGCTMTVETVVPEYAGKQEQQGLLL